MSAVLLINCEGFVFPCDVPLGLVEREHVLCKHNELQPQNGKQKETVAGNAPLLGQDMHGLGPVFKELFVYRG